MYHRGHGRRRRPTPPRYPSRKAALHVQDRSQRGNEPSDDGTANQFRHRGGHRGGHRARGRARELDVLCLDAGVDHGHARARGGGIVDVVFGERGPGRGGGRGRSPGEERVVLLDLGRRRRLDGGRHGRRRGSGGHEGRAGAVVDFRDAESVAGLSGGGARHRRGKVPAASIECIGRARPVNGRAGRGRIAATGRGTARGDGGERKIGRGRGRMVGGQATGVSGGGRDGVLHPGPVVGGGRET